MPLEVALRTQMPLRSTYIITKVTMVRTKFAFPPSTHPKLGVQSKHKGFHSYAL